jgi:hypothetical protein
MIFDTETTGLDKPFCYDVGYIILNMENFSIEKEAHYVIEQIWHNFPLFESAYYKDKRPQYVKLMQSKKATMDKWGYVMRTMQRDIKKYNIEHAYAYNSNFDDKVFAFNCDWFRCINPLETVAIHDIWGYSSEFITSRKDYLDFCTQYERFTDTGNYKSSAEVVYQYITNNSEFIEQHMGLYDSHIESEILVWCIKNGAEWATDYNVKRVLPRIIKKPFTIKINNVKVLSGEYIKKSVQKDVYSFTVE